MLDRKGSSSSEDAEKATEVHAERRGSKGSVRSRTENLNELPDPDEGKTPEERKKIVRVLCTSIKADAHMNCRTEH